MYFAFKIILCTQNLQQFNLESISKCFSCQFWSLVVTVGFFSVCGLVLFGFFGWFLLVAGLFVLCVSFDIVSLFILLFFMFVCFPVVCSESVPLPHRNNNLWVKHLQ